MAEGSPYTNRKRDRHSYVHFYPENWLAGVAGLPRIVWSVYFEICLYNWEKARPIPESLVRLSTSDLPPEQAEWIIQSLLDGEKIEQAEGGGFYSPRAMEEAERALRVWRAKVEGGSKKKKQTPDTLKAHLEDTSKSVKKFQKKGGEFEDTSSTPPADLEDTSKTPRKNEESSKTPVGVLDRTKNQEPTYRKEEATASSKREQHEFDPDEGESAFMAVASLRAAEAREEQARQAMAMAVVTLAGNWNTLAVKHGWPQIAKMTEKRRELVTARITEHGLETMQAALERVPLSDYLMGRTPHKVSAPAFDWVFSEDTSTKLIEGFYNRIEQKEASPEYSDDEQMIRSLRVNNFRRLQIGEIDQAEFEIERTRVNALAAKLKV